MKSLLLTHLFLALFISSQSARSQEVITLQQAIELALENNLQLKQARLNVDMSGTDLWQARGNYLPTLNGFASQNWNYGRTIDPLTNQFATNTVQSNNFGLNSSFDLFAGFQNYNTLQKSKIDLEVSQADLEKMRNDVVLMVISAYMQVLFSNSILEVRAEQLALTRLQETRISKLVTAGALAESALLDIRAQVAAEELQQVSAENNARIALLNLRQSMDLPADRNFMVAEPGTDKEPAQVTYTPTEIYQQAERNLPEIRAAELRLRSATKNLAIARGAMSPRLSLGAGVGTGYSELRKIPSGVPQLNGYDTLGFTTGAEYVLVPNYSYDLETIPFNEQIEDNLNRSVNINLSIPLINGLAIRTNINRAKIGRQNAELNLELQKRQVEKTVEQAYVDATGAYNRYLSAKLASEAAEKSFQFMEQRFNLGAANAVEYSEAKNRVTQANSELLQARYEFYFKKGILDFYSSNSLTF